MELLSPVGDFDCLKAAVQNGADSVYFGVEQFNARMYAENFTLENLKEAVALANEHSSKGDVILLSPGSASWDQYKCFEDRGTEFKELVKNL